MATAADNHVHLQMQQRVTVPRWRRWLVVAMTTCAVALIASAFFFPWWHFTLYAPQYPHGLNMTISLTGVTGDVGEIDELNHYIGMAKIEGVAPVERHFASYGVAALGAVLVVMTLAMGKRSGWLNIAPALAFPIVFMGDTYYWLHLTGHALDKHAAIRLAPFTPEMFGNGQIGQFLTFAAPSIGFWIACAGAALVVGATVIRQRSVCARCSQRGTCGALCKNAFLGKEHPT